MKFLVLIVTVFVCVCFSDAKDELGQRGKLVYLTVATHETDGYKRFMRSCLVYDIHPKVLGMGTNWLGGDMNHPGGGYKVNLLQEELKQYKDDPSVVVIFSDSYDVIVTGGKDEILKAFYAFNASVVFSSEDYCWPDKSLKKEYPLVLHGYRYLNSGGFIGYAPQLYKIVSQDIENTDDDQLFYTKLYLNPGFRKTLNMKLDTQAKIFQNLHGNIEDVALDFVEGDTKLINTVYHTNPIIIHGNGPSKVNLNQLGNYLAKSWTKTAGCVSCSENLFRLEEKKEDEYPKVLMAIFINIPTPFLEEMLRLTEQLSYPHQKLYVFVYNAVPSHDKVVDAWVEEQKLKKYLGVKYIRSSDKVTNWPARSLAIDKCLDIGCDVYFNVEGEVHLEDRNILKKLITYNRPILAPIITQQGKLWSTFWGAVTGDGFYARSSDYMEIVNYSRTGIWNVPYIYAVYIIWKSVLEDLNTRPDYVYKLTDQDIAMTTNFRKKGVFMYAVNLEPDYGHLINLDAVSTTHLHNDLWQVAVNVLDWEKKYLHPRYYEALEPSVVNHMPCTDVYWFPIFTEKFCQHMIELMEEFGVWSGGKNEDPRLEGGYENVPTDDIHMNQIEFEQEWLYILKTYIKPLAEKVFLGYTSDARALMNFVVRYKPTAQNYLRPHHDSSTYTINVGLNRAGIDYEGGGSNFIRQNCSVTATKVGWAIMHPGRLTHYHEGLPTTKGTRYILVSFIDP